MRTERIILIAFLGNYLINNLVTATVALLGFSGGSMMQYTVYIVLAAVATALFTWWYLQPLDKSMAIRDSIIFGVSAFVVAVLTAIVSGIASVLAQTGSFAQLATVIPNFGPFLMNWATLAILGYWVIPAAFMGWIMHKGKSASASPLTSMRATPPGAAMHASIGAVTPSPAPTPSPIHSMTAPQDTHAVL